MSRLGAYLTLERLGSLIATREAAAALGMSAAAASRMLHRLEDEGHAHRVRSGVWAIGPTVPDPFEIASELVRPHPAYVSFTSALNFHGLIDQIPREITVASLGRARRIPTTLGTYAIHHLPPGLFGGWEETRRGPIATPEKAVFDLSYASVVHTGRARHIPELELRAGFDRVAITRWVARIASPRLRTMTARAVEEALARATR